MKTTNRKAFSLIELLLAAVVFAMVGSFALISLATTVKLQTVNRQSQKVILQGQQILKDLETDIQNSVYTNDSQFPKNPLFGLKTTPLTTASVEGSPPDDLITYVIPDKDINGLATQGLYYRRVVCAEVNAAKTGKRVIRYTFTTIKTPATISSLVVANCDLATLRTLFGDPVGDPVYLTDTTTNVRNLRFWSTYSKSYGPLSGESPIYDPPAVRIEFTAQYSLEMDPEAEARVSDSKLQASQITLTSLVSRHPSFTIKQ